LDKKHAKKAVKHVALRLENRLQYSMVFYKTGVAKADKTKGHLLAGAIIVNSLGVQV